MEENDAAKEWFVTHEDKQFGPVSIDDLKFEVERGELNPRLDRLWKSGMEDWIPAGELEGLFEKNDEAKAAEEAKETTGNFSGYVSGDTQEDIERAKGKPPGAGRWAFFFFTYIFPVLWGVGIGLGLPLLEGKLSADILNYLPLVLLFVPISLMIAVTLQRFQNLGMSRMWFLGMFVPILSLWVYYRTLACPPGYAEHKKLDVLGWILAIIYWLGILIFMAAFAFMVNMLMKDPKAFEKIEGDNRQELEEFMEKNRGFFEKFQKPADEEKSSETIEPRTY